MKTHSVYPIKASLSLPLVMGLSLLACQPSPQQATTPLIPGNQVQSVLLPAPKPMLEHSPQVSGSAHYDPEQQRLSIHISADFKPHSAFQTQAVQCGQITKLKVSLEGLGIAPGTFSQTVTASDCDPSGLNVSFVGVPVGKARVLKIEALDSSNNFLPNADIMAAFDIENSAQTIIVSQASTPLAEAIVTLSTQYGSKGQYLIGKLDLNPAHSESFGKFMQTAVAAAVDAGHPRLININTLISTFISNNGAIPASVTPFIQTFGSVIFNLNGPDGNYVVQLSDPSSLDGSVAVNTNLGSTTVADVLPGTWQAKIYSPTEVLLHTTTVTVGSGGSTTISFNEPITIQPPSAEWSMLNGPEGGHVYSLHDLGSGQWLAGTSAGIYRTANLTNLAGDPWVYGKGLEGKKVLSLLKSDGQLYAGINAAELYFKDNTNNYQGVYLYNAGNSTWEPVTDSNLTNIDVYDLIEGSTPNIYGATSDGVIEKSVSSWSKVNGPSSLLAGRRITDIHYFNSAYYIASPDQDKIYQAISPGGGWSEVGTFPVSDTPLSVSADGANVFAGTQQGNVYRFESSTWIKVNVGSSPNAAVTQITNFTDSSTRLRLLAATNGLVNNTVSHAMQTITNTGSFPPFNYDYWAGLGQLGQGIRSPFINHFAKTGTFDADSLAGLLVGTAGAGISQSNASVSNSINPATGENDVDWVTQNSGLLASEIKDIAHFHNGSGDYYFVATKGNGVHRYHDGSWTALNNIPAANGSERFPEALTLDSHGTLYAIYADQIAILYSATTAAASAPWGSLTNPPGSGTLRDLRFSATGNRLLAVESGPGGLINITNACPAPPSVCTISWTAGQFESEDLIGDFYSLAVSEADPSLIYAGAMENIYKSTDGGENWTSLNLLSSPLSLSAGQAVNHLTMGQGLTGYHYLYFTTTGGAPSTTPLYGFYNDGNDQWIDFSSAAGLPASSQPLAIAAQADDPTRLLVSLDQGGVYLAQNATAGASASFGAFDTSSGANPPTPTVNQLSFSSLLLFTDHNANPMLLGGSNGRGLYLSPF